MQATMLIAVPLLPQPKSTTMTHQDLSLLHKPNFISERGSSLGLLPSRPRRSVALHGIRRTFSTQACTIRSPILPDVRRCDFPRDFFFGTASSAYQYEGAENKDGKGASIWDEFTHRYPNKIADGSNGDVALDSYNRFKEHVATMKNLGVNSYRFSIAWPRILPKGKLYHGINEEGIRYYNNLIDELLSNDIKPVVTLFHWDVPQVLDDEYGGFLNSQIINDFNDYVSICFDRFGDRVKHWITLNEPNIFTLQGYVNGTMAPGLVEDHFINPYVVGHNLLLAHANAVDIYRKKYHTQKGQIGIAIAADYRIPATNHQCDKEAAERALDFSLGWFMDPVHFGDYPESMKKLVTNNRLPKITPAQSSMLKGSYDFLGLNYYSSVYIAEVPSSTTPSYLTDGCYRSSSRIDGVPVGPQAGSDWQYIYPQGLKELLRQVKERYNSPAVYITENGISNRTSETMDRQMHDVQRENALKEHLSYLHKAMVKDGVDVKGYFIWTLLDAMEWSSGFTVSFGIHYVDRKNNLKILPKDSAKWYKDFLHNLRTL